MKSHSYLEIWSKYEKNLERILMQSMQDDRKSIDQVVDGG